MYMTLRIIMLILIRNVLDFIKPIICTLGFTFGSYFHCLVCGRTKFAKFVLGCLNLFLVSIDGSKQVSWIFGIS